MKYISLTSIGLFVFIIIFTQCQPNKSAPKKDISGLTISKIQSATIITTTGEEWLIDEEEISKIFYLIRHAEKDTTIETDPPLTLKGEERSAKLADILRGTRLDAIYSTMTLRTMFTVDSIADIKGMTLKPYENKNLKILLDNIREDSLLNRTLIVGHSNTIPVIANALADTTVFNKTIDEDDYSNFIVVLQYKNGSSEVLKLRY